MEEMKMQDIVTIAAGEARAEALLEVVKMLLSEPWASIDRVRMLLGVEIPVEEKEKKKLYQSDKQKQEE